MEDFRALDFEMNDLSYSFKEHNPPRNIHSRAHSLSSQEIRSAVLQSPRMKTVMRETAQAAGCGMESVKKEVEVLLEEIGHKMSLPAIRLIACLLRGVLRKILSAIFVNKDGLAMLSAVARDWPVVLVPSHRSYLDFILVSYIMYEYSLPLPCIAAGLDFMAMKGVGSLLRHSGAFFLRRTFGSDELYKATFSEYVKTVLCSQDHPMEFFVEGTRSRAGKSLHPKLGLLSMVMEPYLEGRLPDIMMVPISISYERTLEELLFARELLGVPKPKESTTGLLRVISLLSEDYGSIYVNIGKPVSVHGVCQRCGLSRIPHSLIPRVKSELLPEEKTVVKQLGHVIMAELHNGMVIFPTSLVATALLHHTHTGLHMGDLEDFVGWLETQVLHRGGSMASPRRDAGEMTRSGLKMLTASVELSTSNHLIELAVSEHCQERLSPVSMVDLCHAKLQEPVFKSVLEVSLSHLLLAHYRNQLLHIFLQDALLAMSLQPEISYEVAFQRFTALLSALACEFVLPLRDPGQLFAEGVHCFEKRGVLACTSEGKLLSLQASQDRLVSFLQKLLQPFVLGVWILCHQLLSLDGGVQSQSATVRHTQRLAVKTIQHGLVGSYEVLSLGMIKNALASLHQAGLILQTSSEFATGQDRLVKVVEQCKLSAEARILGDICRVEATPPTSHL